MTQAVMVAHSYLTKAIELVIESIVGFFKSFIKSIVASRQLEANMKIVPYLRTEYKGKTDAEILHILNQDIIEEFKK